MDVLIAYISGKEAFKYKENWRSEVDQLNIEIKMTSQNEVERIYNRVNSDAKHFRPAISLLEKLVEHSHESEGVSVTLTFEYFTILSEVWIKESKIVFNRELASFNLLHKELTDIGKITKEELEDFETPKVIVLVYYPTVKNLES